MHWTRPGRDIAQTVLSCLEWELCETLSQAGVSHVIARYKATWNLGHKRQSWQIAISMCFAVYCFRFGTRDNVASYPGPRTLSGESKLQAHFSRPGLPALFTFLSRSLEQACAPGEAKSQNSEILEFPDCKTRNYIDWTGPGVIVGRDIHPKLVYFHH